MINVLGRLDVTLDEPPFNFIIHSAPCKTPDLDYYHWHIEIMPKLTKVAGFEWGSGFYINPTPPEYAAETLRDANIGGADDEKSRKEKVEDKEWPQKKSK